MYKYWYILKENSGELVNIPEWKFKGTLMDHIREGSYGTDHTLKEKARDTG